LVDATFLFALPTATVFFFIFTLHVNVHSFEFPDPFFLPTADLRVGLFDYYDVRQRMLVAIIEIFKFLARYHVQVVTEHCVIEIQEFSKVGMDNEDLSIWFLKLCRPDQLDLNHSELVSLRHSAR
jgi:hypothetical protein